MGVTRPPFGSAEPSESAPYNWFIYSVYVLETGSCHYPRSCHICHVLAVYVAFIRNDSSPPFIFRGPMHSQFPWTYSPADVFRFPGMINRRAEAFRFCPLIVSIIHACTDSQVQRQQRRTSVRRCALKPGSQCSEAPG